MHETMRHPLESGAMRDPCLLSINGTPAPAAGAAAHASTTTKTTTITG